MAKEPKDSNDLVWPEDLFMEEYFMWAARDPVKEKARKLRNARCGHIKRKLIRNEQLTGELLKLALEILEPMPENEDEQSKLARGIATKLRHRMPLDEYEFHMVVDVWLLHVRLGF